MKRQYFYKDKNGNTKRYIYCGRGCSEPYTQEQLGIDIFEITGHMYFCDKCKKDLNLGDRNDNGKKIKSDEFEVEIKKVKSKNFEKEVSDILFNEPKEEISDLSEVTVTEEKLSNQNDGFCAYILKCNDGTFYSGVTTSLKKAIRNHNSGSGSPYTKERRPVVLVVSREAKDMEEAKKIKIELQKDYKIK